MVYSFITNPKTLVPNTLAKAEDVNAIVNAIFSGLKDISSKIQIGQLLVSDIQYGGLTPIGSIIPFYDYGGLLTFDTDYWAYCDGSIVSINGTNYTLPDLSGRYIVGFGTPGGGNIDTATWETTAVGNTAHQININHYHTVNSHTHTIAHTHTYNTVIAHTHTITTGVNSADHTHNVSGATTYDSGLTVLLPLTDVSGTIYPRISAGGGAIMQNQDYKSSGHSHSFNVTSGGISAQHTHSGTTASTGSASGTTSGTSTANSGSTSPNTNSQLSTTQSIQPESIRVRYIMRIA